MTDEFTPIDVHVTADLVLKVQQSARLKQERDQLAPAIAALKQQLLGKPVQVIAESVTAWQFVERRRDEVVMTPGENHHAREHLREGLLVDPGVGDVDDLVLEVLRRDPSYNFDVPGYPRYFMISGLDVHSVLELPH